MYDELELLIELEKNAALLKTAGALGRLSEKIQAFVTKRPLLAASIPLVTFGLGGVGGYMWGRRRRVAGLEPAEIELENLLPFYFPEDYY